MMKIHDTVVIKATGQKCYIKSIIKKGAFYSVECLTTGEPSIKLPNEIAPYKLMQDQY